MPIAIRRGVGGYWAQVTPPEGELSWTTERMLSAQELLDALLSLGCHTTDIADAFHRANPDWLTELS